MSKALFLSYGREPEVTPFVTKLKHDLEGHGFSVWLNTEDIPAGCDWHAAIGTGLDHCKALIAVITNKYITSRYCMSELYTANGDQKLIFPVIVEEVDFSSTERARGVKYVVSGINWTMFRQGYDDYNTSLGKLVFGMKEQGLGPATTVASTDMTDSGVDSISGQMSQLQVSPSGPSAPPRPSSPANPGYPAPYSMPPPTSPANPGYQTSPPGPYAMPPHTSPVNPGYQTSPPGPYTTPPHQGHPSPYNYHPYPGYPPSPHTQPYPGYYTSPPGGYVPPMQYPHGQQYPGYPPHANMPPTSGGYVNPPQPYPYPTPPVPGVVQSTPEGDSQGAPPNYGALFPDSVTDGSSGEKVGLGDNSVSSSSPQTESSKKAANFRVGMKLEAVDRRFPYFVCVATVMDRNDNDIMVHFDGWGPEYNYWCPRDSVEIHPSGWCLKHDWELQKPLNQEWNGWPTYLSDTQSDSAQDELFTENQLAGPESLQFSPGMRLEAKDNMNPSLTCVATIKEVNGGKVLIHFDGWGNEYDYWCEAGSTDLHPAMWCGKNGKQVHPPQGYKGHFKWSEYLSNEKINPAPAHLFNEEQRSADGRRKTPKSTDATLDGFQVGMKLEARDRLNPSVVCVATISDIKDGQLLIHFDGWTSKYDYWCKPTSKDIHPRGWCLSSNKDLQPPRGYVKCFDWSNYLSESSTTSAPDKLFTEDQKASIKPHFKAGMKLEAKDRLNPSLICVASVTNVKNKQLLIHFDGWTTKYDFWCNPDSTDIHPIGWCQAQGRTLQPPKGHSGPFNWNSYLASTLSIAAPSELFSQAQRPVVQSHFRTGMKLEAKDRKNPSLICVASITDMRNNQLLIHFDGWTSAYDYWCDPDTTDIHPISWCQSHGYSLQAPHGYFSAFSWSKYLQETGTLAAPDVAFTPGQK